MDSWSSVKQFQCTECVTTMLISSFSLYNEHHFHSPTIISAAEMWSNAVVICEIELFRPPGPAAAGRVGLYILLLHFFLTPELIDENRPSRRPSILYQQWCPLLNS